MKSEEEKLLFIEKIHEGKSEKQALKEIERDNLSQIKFRNLEKELSLYKRKVERLEDEVKKWKSKSFIQGLKSQEVINKNIKINGSLEVLKRMLKYLDKSKEYSIKQLSEELCTSSENIKACIFILKLLNHIEELKRHTVIHYKLKC